MKDQIFIDTGAFYARYDRRDRYHERALDLWTQMKTTHYTCLTTNFILLELSNLFVRRLGTPQALQSIREIYHSNIIETFDISRDLEIQALEVMEKFSDQDFSMTDATSFVVMKEKGIKTAFTFDTHFKIAGFEIFE